MNAAEEHLVRTALAVLQNEGFDVNAILRELGTRSMARSKAEFESASLASLDLTLEAVLLESPDPLLTLRQRGAALTKEIDHLKLELDREQAKKESVRSMLLGREERREMNRRIATLKEQVAARKWAQREFLEKTRELSAKKRREENAHFYDGMRISKIGVRGESHMNE